MQEAEKAVREAIASGDEEQLHEAAYIMKRFLASSTAASAAPKVASLLVEVVESDAAHRIIRSAAFYGLATLISNHAILEQLPCETVARVAVCAARSLATSDVAAAACAFIKSMPPSCSDPALIAALKAAAESSEVSALRVVELARDCHSAWTTEIVSEFHPRLLASPDVAVSINAVELLSSGDWRPEEPPPAQCVAGLAKLVEDTKTAELVGRAALRAIGEIAKRGASSLEVCISTGAAAVAVRALRGESALAVAAIEAVAGVASSPRGLGWLEASSDGRGAVSDIASYIESARDSATRLVATHAVSVILESPEACAMSDQLRTLVFAALKPSPSDAIANTLYITRQTADEPAAGAAFRLLAAFARHEWGLAGLVACPGLLETLSDRRADPAGAEPSAARRRRTWRYAVVSAMHAGVGEEKSKQIVGAEWHAKLARFVAQGVHYIAPGTAVDWQGND
jgi:hypothetical protein